MQGFVSREESDVRTAFTHLSNQATISQLSLLMSESETDTDNLLSNDTSRHDDTLSDVGSHATELHELCVVTKDVDIGHQMPLLSTESGIYMDDGDNGGHSAAFSRSGSEATDARPSDEDDSFDDIVKKNLIEDQWDTIESKTSLSPSITNVDHIRTTITEKQTFDIEKAAGICASIIEEETVDTVGAGLPSISVSCDGDDAKMADSDDGTLDGDDATDDPLFLDCIKNHTVPLPSFEDIDDSLSHTSHDVDDFVPSGADSSTAEEEDAESEDGSWNLSPSSSSLFSNISAYDNFGKKKVGRDDIAPVMMLIPNSDEFIQSPKVGDR